MSEQDLHSRSDFENIDPLLRALARVSEMDISIGVTLWVHGKIVSGSLISRRKYLNLIKSAYEGLEGGANKEFASYLQRTINDIPVPTPESINSLEIGYIHIAEPYFVNEIHSIPSQPWRCKIVAIDAFLFGVIKPSER